MRNVLAAATASAIVAFVSTSDALACEQTLAAIQEAATASKVLLAQATQQGNPAAQPGRGAQSEASVGDKSAPHATPDQGTGSTNQPSVEQKEEAQKLGQEVK